jgi:hypothetical protein
VSPSPSALPCPECGFRATRIAPPRWARATGLPLLLAVLSALTLGLLAIQHTNTVRSGIARSATEPWIAPSIRAHELRAAAAGDDALAQTLAGAALAWAAADDGALSTSALDIAPFRGPGYAAVQHHLGWPLRWFTCGRFTQYDDIAALRDPVEPEIPSKPAPHWRWLPWEPGIMYSYIRGSHHRALACNFGALAATLLLITSLAFIIVQSTRRRSRGTRKRAAAIAACIAALLLFTHRTRERAEVPWPRPTHTPLLADVTALSRTPAGRRALAQQLAPRIADTPDDALIQIFWKLPMATRDTTTIGNPSWFGYAVHTPMTALVHDAPLAQRRLSILQDCILCTTIDDAGIQRLFWFSYAPFAAVLAPTILLCASPRLLWLLLRRRRERRWTAQQRCLNCGYTSR